VDEKLVNLQHDIDEARHAESVCKTCLVDLLASALDETLAQVGHDYDTRMREPMRAQMN
jgi:hypothetical protein